MRPRLSAQRVPVLQSQAGQSEEKQARGEQHLRLGVPLSLVATRHGRICHHCLQDLLSAPCRALSARVAVELLEGTALLMFSVELLFLGTLTQNKYFPPFILYILCYCVTLTFVKI